MTATAHAIIGAAIAAKIANPAVGLPFAFASHFVCDKIPHWDPMTDGRGKSKRRIILESALDVALGFSLVLVFFLFSTLPTAPTPLTGLVSPTGGSRLSYFLLAAFAAQLPDWLEIPYLFTSWRPAIFVACYKVQKWIHDLWFDARLPAPAGLLTQAATVLLFLLWSVS